MFSLAEPVLSQLLMAALGFHPGLSTHLQTVGQFSCFVADAALP